MSMQALIAPNQPVATGYRVAEVSEQAFDVAAPLFWADCADDVVPDLFFYDPQDQTIKPIPAPQPEELTAGENQPTVQGAQTL